MPPKKLTSDVSITKASIPRALREQVWIVYAGRVFERKCLIPWCHNTMSVFDFHVAHDIPESVGGAMTIANLRPICSRCNLSMGASYTVQQWAALSPSIPTISQGWWNRFLRCCCFCFRRQ